MTDVDVTVGHLTLTGKIRLGVADSDDVGSSPDSVPAVARVTITASVPRVVEVATKTVLALPTISASLNGAGQLVAPADGFTAVGSSAAVHLIATNQDAITPVGWHWVVAVEPIDGQTWAGFSVIVSGKPDSEHSIGQALINGDLTGLGAILAGAYVVEGTGTDGVVTEADLEDVPLNSVWINTATDPGTWGLYR